MSTKTSADVLIGGKIYTLSGYESEAYLQQVAAYINNKINEFDELESYRRLPPDMKAVLLELNIADDFFKARNQAEQLTQDMEIKGKDVYELKHDLITVKMKLEDKEKEIHQMEKEIKEVKRLKQKLEMSLEDALLGKIKGAASKKGQTDQQIHKNDVLLNNQQEQKQGEKDTNASTEMTIDIESVRPDPSAANVASVTNVPNNTLEESKETTNHNNKKKG